MTMKTYGTVMGYTVGPAALAVYITLYKTMKYCNYLTSGDVNSGVYTGWSYDSYSTPRDTTHRSFEQNNTVNMNGNVWEWMEDS